MNCPLNAMVKDCTPCAYQKEGLCDYPFIGKISLPISEMLSKNSTKKNTPHFEESRK